MTTATRRQALSLGATVVGATVLGGGRARAQQRFFRIGTGGTGGTYYPVGGMIANAISTDKINVSAVATNGSVANVNGIVGGSMEFGLQPGRRQLLGLSPAPASTRASPRSRSCASSPTSIRKACTSWSEGPGHQVASPISRASASRSTSRAPARSSMPGAFSPPTASSEKDIKPEYLKQTQSRREAQGRLARRLLPDHRLSAGHAPNSPPPTASSCCRSRARKRDKLMAQFKFFAKDKIPAGIYKDVPGARRSRSARSG